ncbi:MAG TPA: nitronate monooxygenase [Candidatus Gastranaerophilales bacterium]|nr:nitronate monooxygenase [Candidatus Gastranaerophilales bacterium]
MNKNLFELAKLKLAPQLPEIKPIVQGGMAIKISTAKLAASVANCGGLGIIAASGLTKEELQDQIRQARELQLNKKGLIGINIMYAASDFNMLVKTAMEEGIDVVIFGAGFSRDVFSMGEESNTPIIPIVSSAKLAKISRKLGATSVIVESGEAGGHLGTCENTDTLLVEVKQALDEEEAQDGRHVPIVAAGGAVNGFDIAKLFKLGAEGVQMGTRFVLSKECEVSAAFKQLYLSIKESDVITILSPVGLSARAILNDFSKKILDGAVEKPLSCERCLKKCSRAFCLMKSLKVAESGNVQDGLIFVGKNVCKIKEILSVEEIFEKIEKEFNLAFAESLC